MNSTDYVLPLTAGVWAAPGVLVVHDGDFGAERRLEVDAQVRSGGYFVMLATKLEVIAGQLPRQDRGAGLMLNEAIRDLDYLNDHYTIEKRPKRG